MPNLITRLARAAGYAAAVEAPPLVKAAPLAGPAFVFTGDGRAVWTARDGTALAREGFQRNAVVHRCVRLVAEAAASLPLFLTGPTAEAARPLAALLALARELLAPRFVAAETLAEATEVAFPGLVGVLPGISPLTTIAMLLPLTFGMAPASGMIMLAGIFYGAQYGGSTTAILVNVPGETSAVVTCIDGYQMARQGRAGPALATAALGSFFAGSVATFLLAVFAPPLSNLALKFGAPEYFALMGDFKQAIQQLEFAKRRANNNFQLASRIDARQQEIIAQERAVKDMMN